MSNSVWPGRRQPTRLRCPWDSPGKNTRVSCHALLQGIFPTQGSNPCLLHFPHWQVGSLPVQPLLISKGTALEIRYPGNAPMQLLISTHLYYTLEKAMAPHSSTLAWKIPWTEEPDRSLRVGHDWVTFLSLFTFMHWRRKRQPTPVFVPGESQERRSLVGCRLWGRAESDTTEVT